MRVSVYGYKRIRGVFITDHLPKGLFRISSYTLIRIHASPLSRVIVNHTGAAAAVADVGENRF